MSAEVSNSKSLTDKNWSTPPSQLDKKDMCGSIINEPLLRTKKIKEIDGMKYIVHQNNIIIYDEELQLLLDSSIAANTNTTGLNIASVAAPPDDPRDVLLDNDKLTLLVAAIFNEIL